MKKLFTLILSAALVFTAAACSSKSKTQSSATSSEAATTESVKDAATIKSEIDAKLDAFGFKGVVFVTRQGEALYQSATGEDEKGNALTVDSTLYIGSLSKSVCAASVLMLRDQGKLSVDDTLDKYFPEYSHGKEITIKNLLSMRSGLDEVRNASIDAITADSSEEDNIAATKAWIFGQELVCAPDSAFDYCNTNYNLLAYIVEQVSGMHYNDFVRRNVFEPLGMTHSGFVDEVRDNPAWASGLTYDSFMGKEASRGAVKGAGDIASNAADMDAYMTALQNGKLLSKESFADMSANYSPDHNPGYGYGLWPDPYGGVGHNGGIGSYYGRMYMQTEQGINLFISGGEASGGNPEDMAMALIKIVAG